MKRAVLVSAGTAAGLAVVLLLNPTSQKTLQAAGAATTSAPKSTGPDAGAGASGGSGGAGGAGDSGTGTAPQRPGRGVGPGAGDGSGATNGGSGAPGSGAPGSGDSGSGSGGSGSGGSGSGGSGSGGSGSGSGDSGSGDSGTASGTGKTYEGDTVQTRWGPVQVQVTVADGRLADVQAVQLPDGDQRSYWISQQVGPMLREQALQAQSAQIDGVSGATYTSMGYQQSLASALDRAGL